jgi:glycosyltransferase involved in cell wall biosynthesis
MSGNKKLRCLFLNHWAAHLGGAEISLLDILNATVQRAETWLVCTENGPLIQRAQKGGVLCKIITCSQSIKRLQRNSLFKTIIKHIFPLLSFFVYVMKVRLLVSQIKPDIIHANIPKSHMTLCLISLTGFRGRCVFHIREIFDYKSAPYVLYGVLFPRKRSSVIAISNAVKHSLPSPLKTRTTVIYNGIKVYPREYIKRHVEGVRFLFLGRVVPWKGCHILIDAFVELYKRVGNRCGVLDIVGDTIYWDQMYRCELENRIKQVGFDQRITLFPHSTNVFKTLSEHDVLCMASDREPFGRVAAEAQSVGLPVIGFDSGGLAEVIQNEVGGILVPLNDYKLITDAMLRFISDPELILKMGNAGRERVEKMFDIEFQIEKITSEILNGY